MHDFLLRVMARFQAEEGQGMVEYALILALVSVVAIAMLQSIGTQVSVVFSEAASALTAA